MSISAPATQRNVHSDRATAAEPLLLADLFLVLRSSSDTTHGPTKPGKFPPDNNNKSAFNQFRINHSAKPGKPNEFPIPRKPGKPFPIQENQEKPFPNLVLTSDSRIAFS